MTILPHSFRRASERVPRPNWRDTQTTKGMVGRLTGLAAKPATDYVAHLLPTVEGDEQNHVEGHVDHRLVRQLRQPTAAAIGRAGHRVVLCLRTKVRQQGGPQGGALSCGAGTCCAS